MKSLYKRVLRLLIVLWATSLICRWLIPSVIFKSNNEDDHLTMPDDFIDNHVYPPPWYFLNWTINDYFIRKDYFKVFEDQYAIKMQQKVMIEYNLLNRQLRKSQNYTILEYTTVFNAPKFCGKTQDFIFGKQCPYKNCRYTCDRNQSTLADVLLMHRSDINFDQLPVKRDPGQIWLLWNDEPDYVGKQANAYRFNWTISYRLGAEISIGAYGLTVLRNRPMSIQEFDSYVNRQFDNRQSYGLWFVSNCKPKARLQYYYQLRYYYSSIKVYGRCVETKNSKPCHRHSKCESIELSNNKFYLAFESQSCRDYVTEKFWRSLAFGAIPIVFGPRNVKSLTRMAPPNSFIYTGDFKSVYKLGQYLKEISHNRTLYKAYHRWRRFYHVLHQPQDIESYRFCELCYRLNTNQNAIYYQDLSEFFHEEC